MEVNATAADTPPVIPRPRRGSTPDERAARAASAIEKLNSRSPAMVPRPKRQIDGERGLIGFLLRRFHGFISSLTAFFSKLFWPKVWASGTMAVLALDLSLRVIRFLWWSITPSFSGKVPSSADPALFFLPLLND